MSNGSPHPGMPSVLGQPLCSGGEGPTSLWALPLTLISEMFQLEPQ